MDAEEDQRRVAMMSQCEKRRKDCDGEKMEGQVERHDGRGRERVGDFGRMDGFENGHSGD